MDVVCLFTYTFSLLHFRGDGSNKDVFCHGAAAHLVQYSLCQGGIRSKLKENAYPLRPGLLNGSLEGHGDGDVRTT